MSRVALFSALALNIAISTDGIAEVREVQGMALALGTSEKDGAGYVSAELTNISVEAGSVVLCADLQFSIPSLTGREVELWVKDGGTELPWDQIDASNGLKREFKLVSGEDGFVRFDITRDLQAWTKKISGQPTFYLRVRTEEDNRSIAAVPANVKLILHVMSSGNADSTAVPVTPLGK